METVHGRHGAIGRVLKTAIVGLCIVFDALYGQPTGDEILKNVEDALSGVHDFTVTLDVTVDFDRLKVPPMNVTMYFKQPDKVHFESERFALLPREGMALSTGRLKSRYTVERVEGDTLNGEQCWKLTLKPKADRTGLRDLFLYVHPGRWTAERVVSPLFDERVMTASFSYDQVDGHWLPSFLVVKFESTSPDTTEETFLDQTDPPMRRPRLPRQGTVIVRYSDYKINTGLSDEIFRKKIVDE